MLPGNTCFQKKEKNLQIVVLCSAENSEENVSWHFLLCISLHFIIQKTSKPSKRELGRFCEPVQHPASWPLCSYWKQAGGTQEHQLVRLQCCSASITKHGGGTLTLPRIVTVHKRCQGKHLDSLTTKLRHHVMSRKKSILSAQMLHREQFVCNLALKLVCLQLNLWDTVLQLWLFL
jgi:hypothetical protein